MVFLAICNNLERHGRIRFSKRAEDNFVCVSACVVEVEMEMGKGKLAGAGGTNIECSAEPYIVLNDS